VTKLWIALAVAVIALSTRAEACPSLVPSASAYLSIDAVDFAAFKPNFENRLHFQARVLVPGYSRTVLRVENLSEFPFATFDSKTGDFRWTLQTGPSEGTVSKLELRFVAYPDNETKPVVSMTKTVLIFVSP
jgi:hypothetical protein